MVGTQTNGGSADKMQSLRQKKNLIAKEWAGKNNVIGSKW